MNLPSDPAPPLPKHTKNTSIDTHTHTVYTHTRTSKFFSACHARIHEPSLSRSPAHAYARSLAFSLSPSLCVSLPLCTYAQTHTDNAFLAHHTVYCSVSDSPLFPFLAPSLSLSLSVCVCVAKCLCVCVSVSLCTRMMHTHLKRSSPATVTPEPAKVGVSTLLLLSSCI